MTHFKNLLLITSSVFLTSSFSYGGGTETLPDEVALNILSKTSLQTVGRMAQVSSHFKGLVEADKQRTGLHDREKKRGIPLKEEMTLHEHFAAKLGIELLPDKGTLESLKDEWVLRKVTQDWAQRENSTLEELFAVLLEKTPHTLKSLFKTDAAGAWYSIFDYSIEEIDALIELHNQSAVERKIKALTESNSPEDAVRSFLEEQLSRGNLAVLSWKMDGLNEGKYGYPQDHAAVRHFIEEERARGNLLPLAHALADGNWSYSQDLATARALIDEQVEQGNEKAIDQKIFALAEGDYGYAADEDAPEDAAREFIEEQSTRGSETAIHHKILGLGWGRQNGYTQDREAARAFIEEKVAQRSRVAIERKAEGLAEGRYGYDKDKPALLTFLKDLAQTVNREEDTAGIWQGLLKGAYFLDEDLLRKVLKELMPHHFNS